MIAAPATFPAPARARWALVVLSLVGFLSALDASMITILVEPMKRELALSDVQIGLLQGTVYGLVVAAVSLPIGRLVDSRNRVPIVLAGVLAAAVALNGTALAWGFDTLVMLRGLFGAVAAMLVPAAVSLFGDFFPPARRSGATSLFVVGQSFGQAVGYYAGGTLFDWLGRLSPAQLHGLTAWRAVYVLTGSASLLLVPLLLSVREPPRQEVAQTTRSIRVAARELWSYREFMLPLVGAQVFYGLSVIGAGVWSAPLLTRLFHLTPGQFSGWLGAITLGTGIVGSLVAGRLAEQGRRRSGPRGVLLPAVLATLLSAPTSAFAVAPTVTLFALALAACLLLNSMIPIFGIVALNLNLPNELRGFGVGLTTLASTLFALAGGTALLSLVSRVLGGEAFLGLAIVVVSVPSALISAALFALAMRGGGNAAPPHLRAEPRAAPVTGSSRPTRPAEAPRAGYPGAS